MGRPRIVKKFARSIDINQGKIGGDGSNYYSSYVEHRGFKPVKNVKPPRTPPKSQFPPMQVETTTMKSYVRQDLGAKRELMVPVEKHVMSNEPLSNVTVYREDFPVKAVLPTILTRPKTSTDESPSHIKFDNRTTNKQFYKDWKPSKKKRYGELPAFTGPLIYPEKLYLSADKDLYKSRTHTDFPYKSIPKPSLVKVAEGNIKVGVGERDLLTTHQSTYQFHEGKGAAAVSMRPSAIAKALAYRKMELTSKYQSDFPSRDEYPLPPQPKTPPPATLEIKMDNKCSFETEQRNQYHGWNVKEHKRPNLSKLEDNTQSSSEPMQTNTTMTMDYTPKDIAASRVLLMQRPKTNTSLTRGQFQDSTTNKSFYKDWGIIPRTRFGDFHEAYKKLQLPNKLKPAGEYSTTTKSVYVEKQGRPRTSMKPPFTTVDTSQLHDFNTVARSCYTYPPASAYEIEDFEVKC